MEHQTDVSALPWEDEGEEPPRPFLLFRGLGPTVDEWTALAPAQQEIFEQEMIAHFTEQMLGASDLMPEGDRHADACETVRDTLRSFFARRGLSLYIGANSTVSYPRRRTIAPDVFAVTDVPVHPRSSWIVAREGKGPDLALEVCHHGSREKDFVHNVRRYAKLGIREYFAFDLIRAKLYGHRLLPGQRRYAPIRELDGRVHSEVLDLDLAVVERAIRFYYGTALLATLREQMAGERQRAEDEHQRAEDERQRAEDERQRARVARGEAIFEILKLRRVDVLPALLQHLQACPDIEVLERWFQQSVSAPQEQLALLLREISATPLCPLPAEDEEDAEDST